MPSYAYTTPAAQAPALLGRVVITAANGPMTVNGAAKTITAGNYYHWSASAAESLIAELATRIQTVGALSAFAITIPSLGSGLIKWDNSAAGVDAVLVFQTSLIGFLGLTSVTLTVPAGQSVFSGNQPRGMWLPGKMPVARACPSTSRGEPVTDGETTTSTDGSSFTTYSSTWYEDAIEWTQLGRARVWKSTEDPTNASFERFWEDVLRPGYPLRYFPDSTVLDYVTFSPVKPLPSRPQPTMTHPMNERLWDVRLPVIAAETG